MSAAEIAAFLGDAKPASDGLLRQLAESVRDRLGHEHPKWEDLYCLNLTSYMGERMGQVLRRVLDAEAQIAELEKAAVEGRAALASFCHDHEDPGSAALGALYLLQQATSGTAMQPGETVPETFRAEHPDSGITLGLYSTAAAARAHCEAMVRREIPGALLDWIEGDEDRVAELVAAFGEDERSTGYVVTALDIEPEYDEEADE